MAMNEADTRANLIDPKLPNDLSEQEAIASKLFEIKEQSLELEQVYSDKLKQLAELKKSILQKAFSGELTNNKCLGSHI